MKTLILARHAKSDWPTGVADIKRPLKERGVKNADFLGGLLFEQSFLPDKIISSPAKRALSTASIIASKLHYEPEILIDEDVYYKGMEYLIESVRNFSPTWDTVMVFGHNPTMENAVRALLGQEADFIMPTGAMACLEIATDSWKHLQTDYVTLRWFLVPRLKRKG